MFPNTRYFYDCLRFSVICGHFWFSLLVVVFTYICNWPFGIFSLCFTSYTAVIDYLELYILLPQGSCVRTHEWATEEYELQNLVAWLFQHVTWNKILSCSRFLCYFGIFPRSVSRLLLLMFPSIHCTEYNRQLILEVSLRGYHYLLPESGMLFFDCQSQWQIISPQSFFSTAFFYHFFFHVIHKSLLSGKSFMWHFIKYHFISLIIYQISLTPFY